MDHLTKQQIVLLCLLVSFVTAVATGITIFSLGDSSGTTGSQNIAYRVIEKTIEQVASDSPVRQIIPIPSPAQTTSAPTELSVSDIANQAGASLIRIYTNPSDPSPKFVTVGVMLFGNNIVAPASEALFAGGSYITVLTDSKRYQITFGKDLAGGLVLLHLSDNAAIKLMPALTAKSSSSLKIGTNVVAVGGNEQSNIVSTGIIKQMFVDNSSGTSINDLITDFKPSTDIASLMLLDTDDNLIGFYAPSSATTTASDEGMYIDAAQTVAAAK